MINRPNQAHQALKAAIVSLALLVGGCASQLPRTSADSTITIAPPPATLPAAQQQLAGMPAAQKGVTAVSWAAAFLTQGRLDAARALMNGVDRDTLPRSAIADWAATSATLALAVQDSDEALRLLNDGDLVEMEAQLPTDKQGRIALLRADALTLNGQYMDSLRQRIQINAVLGDSNRQYNQRLIWTQLMMMPTQALADTRGLSSDSELDGWLELALIYRDPLADIDAQVENLDNWQRRWRGHPAAEQMPDMINALRRAVRNRPQRIAILLPANGPLAPAADAIRDGIMASYYSALSQQHQVPEILFLDTASDDIVNLYNQALAEGAGLVIGPLDKSQASVLASIPSLPVPTLTLNYVESEQLPAQLYQFGLAPEDEARQIARQATVEGMQLAAVLYPQGPWGERVADAFQQAFSASGGLVTARRAYAEDPTAATRALLNIGQSEARARKLRRYTEQPVEFEPRRRTDIDLVFMVANPSQARQLKPALNFHYAQDLQVVATSHVYGGKPAPERDADLNGIRFVDIPWLLDNQSELHRLVDQVWPEGHGRYERLFAMGVDAYRLHARLPMLQALPDSFLPGVTGQLSLGDQRHLQRELQWAWFTSGKPQPMPVVTGTGAAQQDDIPDIVTPQAGP